MEYITFLFIAICFLFFIFKNKRFKLEQISSIYISYAFFIKLFSGFALWYIYTYFYKDKSVNDIYKYFQDGKELAEIFKNNASDFFSVIQGEKLDNPENIKLFESLKFWTKPNSYGIYNDNQTIIILSSLLNLISNNNLLIANLYMSLISFLATFTLYKMLSPYLEWKKFYFFILFLSPSIALWTTGLLKETIILFALSLVVYFTTKLIQKRNIYLVIGLLTSLLTLSISKTYLFGFILPSVGCFAIIQILKNAHIKLFFISSYVLIIVFFITWSYTHNPVVYNLKNKTEEEKRKEYKRVNHISYEKNVLGNNYNILEMLRFKQADYKHEAKLANAKSLVFTKKMDGQLSNFFISIPFGISNGFARPHLFETKSLLFILPALENFMCLLLILCLFIFPKKLNRDEQILIFYFGTFIVLTFIFLGLLVPVLGNLVRYKAPLLPLFYFCLLTLIDKSKLYSFIKKNKYKNPNFRKI